MEYTCSILGYSLSLRALSRNPIIGKSRVGSSTVVFLTFYILVFSKNRFSSLTASSSSYSSLSDYYTSPYSYTTFFSFSSECSLSDASSDSYSESSSSGEWSGSFSSSLGRLALSKRCMAVVRDMMLVMREGRDERVSCLERDFFESICLFLFADSY